MVDTHITGCCWIELPEGKWQLRSHTQQPGAASLPHTSRCQYEVDIAYNNLKAHEPDGEWSKVAPFRILSFDIECAGRKG